RGDFMAASELLDEAQAYHQAALKANPKNRVYRKFYTIHLYYRVKALAGLRDQAAAMGEAEKLRDLGWDPADNAYQAACALAWCVPIVAQDQMVPLEQRQKQAGTYANRAMDLLREAVARGFKDVPLMKKDTDLGPLRQRADFQK